MVKRILVIGATGLLGEPEANDLLGSPRIRLEDWLNGAIERERRDPAVTQTAA